MKLDLNIYFYTSIAFLNYQFCCLKVLIQTTNSYKQHVKIFYTIQGPACGGKVGEIARNPLSEDQRPRGVRA